jgi:cell wall-associated NlpC family hydrolase
VHAMAYVGLPYRWGGGSFEDGFDCSAFVQAAFTRSMGIRLPRTTAEQALATSPIQPHELKAGDLVFFNTLGPRYSHVGIYIGDGRFVHSPRSGAFIRIENFGVNYWQKRFTGARRVLTEERLSQMRPSV